MAFAVRAASAAALVMLAIPAGASAATKTVGAGVHAGDAVRWKFFGFHNIYFPKKGGKNISLLVPDPSRTYAGEVDPAGQPFWFNGQCRLVGNPDAAFPRGGTTENGSKGRRLGCAPERASHLQAHVPQDGTFTY